MQAGYSSDTVRQLEAAFADLGLQRPMRVERYEEGSELRYEMNGVADGASAAVRLKIEKFVGGGFAGQVYRVNIIDTVPEKNDARPAGLHPGKTCALKILIPPSNFSRWFRNALYWVGFQGPFQLQVNPAAARAGALWQKFIRRAAGMRFGDENSVVDIHATFVDPTLGACGEISEWVEGRTWRLEVDDHLDELKRWRRGKPADAAKLGSPEYRAKRDFMRRFVGLLHEIGAHEFARQYEWSTCKSQPNCLKRAESEDRPEDGLVAVDFRAGLALLPFLPMSPGDIKLILQGFSRGSLVQFDRGNLDRLQQFVRQHADAFTGMEDMLTELKAQEDVYRDSIPDVSHNHLRLLFSSKLWRTIFSSALTAWQVRGVADAGTLASLKRHRILLAAFGLLGLVPLLGRGLQRMWGRPAWRRHYLRMLGSPAYLKQAFRGRLIEKAIGWLRDERMTADRTVSLIRKLWPAMWHLPLALLPVGLHRILTDWDYAAERLDFYLARPVRLYFNNALREQWLRDMVSEGREKNLLTTEDAGVILSQIKEPYIQKYLKSLAVHVCTLPVTQLVSVFLAIVYVLSHPEMPRSQAYTIGLGIIALFQVVPISPGSLVRGLYVVYLVVRERNFKDYNIAVFLGFFKYVGYLAFPIQMTYRYPALARFMAGYWATEAVHTVPVFGERGALLEHGVFNLFYNWPLTIRRRMAAVSAMRAAMRPRYWHMLVCFLAGTAAFAAVDLVLMAAGGGLPDLMRIWPLAIFVPPACGAAAAYFAAGAARGRRVIGAACCGALVGTLGALTSGLLGGTETMSFAAIAVAAVWRAFAFAIGSVVGALVMEVTRSTD